MGANGIAIIDFGVWPGSSHASGTVTGQTGITVNSQLEAYIYISGTADHSKDEHKLENLTASADPSLIVASTSFVIEIFSRDRQKKYGKYSVGWVYV